MSSEANYEGDLGASGNFKSIDVTKLAQLPGPSAASLPNAPITKLEDDEEELKALMEMPDFKGSYERKLLFFIQR